MPTARSSPTQSPAIEVFAWQGFSIEHPADFAPATITGARAEGYVRLASAGKLSIQIRWKRSKKPNDLLPSLKEYLAKLERDAKRAKVPFRSEFDREDGRIVYRYTGVGQGRGNLFFSEDCSRVFFLEVIGGRKDALLPAYRHATAGFQSNGSRTSERWSVLGLSFRVPGCMTVDKKLFLAGRTELTLRGRHARVLGSRWAFGNLLIEKHGFEDWARAALNLHGARVEKHERGLSFCTPGILRGTYTLVAEPDSNHQIVALQASCRRPEWRPTWDWLE